MIITRGYGTSSGAADIPNISNISCTSYTPTFNQLIEVTCNITNLTLNSAFVSINGISKPLTNVSGSLYSSGYLPAGTYGLVVDSPIYALAFKGLSGTKKASINNITIIADNTKRFKEARNIELSLIEYITNQINLTWTSTSVVKGYFEDLKKSLPVVCVRLTNPTNKRKELGTNNLRNKYIILIDIFASSDGERLDLTSFITDKVIEGCIYYEYSKTIDNKDIIGAANGRVITESVLSNYKVEMYEDAPKYERYHQSITCLVSKS